MTQHATNDTINALGYVEVGGLAAAIETADAMLKSADVRLLRQLLRDPMQTTIIVEGALGACRAAVDAGQAAALRMDAFVACQVMGRPARDTAEFVLKLAEAGREPFGNSPPHRAAPTAKSAPKTAPPAAPAETPDDGENAKLLAALAGVVGGSGAQALARRVGTTTASVRQRLEALCERGLLVKCGARYRLVNPGGANDK
jgi:ethanolamine utilization protein EutK